jgi:hypothetical protein
MQFWTAYSGIDGEHPVDLIQGKGAFRRFRSELHEEYPELLPAWYGWRETRAARRAGALQRGPPVILGR